MNVTYNSTPKAIDFTGNRLPFEIQADNIEYQGTYGHLTITYVSALSGTFTFLDTKTGELFNIVAVLTPDGTNEIQSGLTTLAAIAEALNNVLQFARSYTAICNDAGTEMYIYTKIFYLAFTPSTGYVIPACLSSTRTRAGNLATYYPEYVLFGRLSILATFDNGVNPAFIQEKDIAELKMAPGENETALIEVGELLKPYLQPYLPELIAPDSFPLQKYFFRCGDKHYHGEYGTIYDVFGMVTFAGFALKGKINTEDFDLEDEISTNKIFLNSFSEIDIYAAANYLLNFLNLNATAETVAVMAKLYYTDLTNATHRADEFDTLPNWLFSFGASINALSLNSFDPTKEIYKYEIWIEALRYTPSAVGILILSGSNDVSADSPMFSPGDVGKIIKIAGAGPGGADFITTITEYVANINVKVSANASTSIFNVPALSWQNGVEIVSPVTFNVIQKPMFVKEFAFLNKYGVIEIFQAKTKESVAIELQKNAVEKTDGTMDDSFIEAWDKVKCSTGSLTRHEADELKYMLMSEGLWEILNGDYKRCIIDAGSITIIEESADINSIEFTYRYNTNL